jgi:hypothetical protein
VVDALLPLIEQHLADPDRLRMERATWTRAQTDRLACAEARMAPWERQPRYRVQGCPGTGQMQGCDGLARVLLIAPRRSPARSSASQPLLRVSTAYGSARCIQYP